MLWRRTSYLRFGIYHSIQLIVADFPHKLVTSFYSPWSQMANHLWSFGLYFITFFLTTPLLDFSWPSVRDSFKFLMIWKPGGLQNMASSCVFAQTILWQKSGVIGSFTLKWRPCHPRRKIFWRTISFLAWEKSSLNTSRSILLWMQQVL